MRRLSLLTVAALLVALPGMGDAFAQSCNGCAIGYMPPGGLSALTSSGTAITSTLPFRIPNGANLEYAELAWVSDVFTVRTVANGGTNRAIEFAPSNPYTSFYSNLTMKTSDTYTVGLSTYLWSEGYFSRSIQGSRTKTLTEGGATAFARVSVPQTAGANYGGGSVGYTVYATDGTDSQSLSGDVRFAVVNKAGTETCTPGEVGTPVLAVSAGGSTLTCTFTCTTAAADTVDLLANCTSSLVQTTFTIAHRSDMQKTNTYTPQ